MKMFKLSMYMVAAVGVMAYAPRAYAFHSGGVAECEGCHTMHNSYEGVPVEESKTPYGQPGAYLLKGNDQGSTCLNCHAETAAGSYHIASADMTDHNLFSVPRQLTPGGDFGWLKMTEDITIRGTPTANGNLGERHGHNIVASDFGFVADSTNHTAPGGTYPAANLACSSCHDPHGKYRRFADGSVAKTGLPIFGSGSYTTSAAPISGVSAVGVYRLLAGVGYQPKSLSGSFAFVNPSPDAVAPSSYNGANTTIAGVKDRVAYGRGMSEWCANCHTMMHNDTYTSGTAGLVHPAGNGAKLTATIATNYATYVSSGIIGTPPDNGYSALAPFEVGITGSTPTDYAALVTFQAAPAAPVAGTANVACVTCHRAHASGFQSMTRFSTINEFMTVADSANGNAAIYDSSTTENKINYGYSTAQQVAAYNGRPATLFGPNARDYCNKCHVKD